MTSQEILTKAIQKAIDGGWDSKVPLDDTAQVVLIANDCVSLKYISEGGALSYSTTFSIFNHEFAKALWGEDHRTNLKLLKGERPLNNWEYELANMVIAIDPIQYLADNMPEDK